METGTIKQLTIREEVAEAIFAAHKRWSEEPIKADIAENVWHAYADAALSVLGSDVAFERAKKAAESWNVCDPLTSISPDAVRAIVTAAFPQDPNG